MRANSRLRSFNSPSVQDRSSSRLTSAALRRTPTRSRKNTTKPTPIKTLKNTPVNRVTESSEAHASRETRLLANKTPIVQATTPWSTSSLSIHSKIRWTEMFNEAQSGCCSGHDTGTSPAAHAKPIRSEGGRQAGLSVTSPNPAQGSSRDPAQRVWCDLKPRLLVRVNSVAGRGATSARTLRWRPIAQSGLGSRTHLPARRPRFRPRPVHPRRSIPYLFRIRAEASRAYG